MQGQFVGCGSSGAQGGIFGANFDLTRLSMNLDEVRKGHCVCFA
jgi:hypothetical protein